MRTWEKIRYAFKVKYNFPEVGMESVDKRLHGLFLD